MPDLDLIKQGKQECGRFGEADPSISSELDKDYNQCGRILLMIWLQEQQTARRRFNEWL